MRFVVDANVVVSSLIAGGVSFRVFALNSVLNKFEFIAPDFLISETEKHIPELFEETRLPGNIFFDTLNFLFEEIDVIPSEEFREFVPESEKILSTHLKDVPYLALALKLNCPIFSGDKVLRRLSPVKVRNPRELLDILLGKATL